MPKISIIIPVYNAEQYLVKCLDSVIAQSFKDFETICINDGSSDNSKLILDTYKNKDNRIKNIFKENGGPSKARNIGLEHAKGEYITFVDADDIIHSDYLKILLENASEKVISKCSFISFDDKPDFHKTDFFITTEYNSLDYYSTTKDINLANCGKLIHRSLIANYRFDENCYFSEDILFFADIFKEDLILKELDINLYGYLNNPNSLVHKESTTKKILSLLLVVETLSEKFCNNKIVYKFRIAKAFSNILKSLNNYSGDPTIIYRKIQKLYKSGIISYKHLSLRKRIQLFNILIRR